MSSRLEICFAALASKERKGLIAYVMAGDPDLATSERIIAGIAEAGADIVEIGMPFSDPMADGPTIQAAAIRSLASGTTVRRILEMVRELRQSDMATPYILMGYYNSVYRYGIERFCAEAAAAGVDGMILVDLPPEEEDEFVSVAAPLGLKLIRLIAPSTDDARLATLQRNAGGFLYYISIAGITGTKSADQSALQKRVGSLKAQSTLPIAVGFGIKTPEQAAATAKFSDAVVVGSALVEKIVQGEEAAVGFVKELRTALDNNNN